MPSPALQTPSEAIDRLKSLLGEDAVFTNGSIIEEASQNTSAFDTPQLSGLVIPESIEQLKEIINVAREFKVQVYPYSTGFNWGLGSRLPACENCILLSLEKLNKIREVNEDYHYAVVEPGVTQKQLVDYLKDNGKALQLNVTGSSPHSSVVGNILEKGTGFRNHRIEDVRGMEVLLGNGEHLRTGFWDDAPDHTTVHHFKYGLGPYLDGIFLQSNLGIVTAAVVNLIPERDDVWMLTCHVTDNKLQQFINNINWLYRDHYLQSSMHIGNEVRTRIASEADEGISHWTSWTTISGDRKFLEFVSQEITLRLSQSCKSLNFFSSEQLNDSNTDPFIREMYLLHQGNPSHLFLRAMGESIGDLGTFDPDNIDQSRYGMLCCLPIIPFSGYEAQRAKSLIYEVCAKYNTTPAVTLNPMNDLYLEAVINLYFDRKNDKEITMAHQCNEELHESLYEAGYRFYRMDIKLMRKYITEDSPFWRTIRELKSSLDPEGIIAPMRYNLA
jgi:4-cresol dehydrogenase (hydroxylating)